MPARSRLRKRFFVTRTRRVHQGRRPNRANRFQEMERTRKEKRNRHPAEPNSRKRGPAGDSSPRICGRSLLATEITERYASKSCSVTSVYSVANFLLICRYESRRTSIVPKAMIPNPLRPSNAKIKVNIVSPRPMKYQSNIASTISLNPANMKIRPRETTPDLRMAGRRGSERGRGR